MYYEHAPTFAPAPTGAALGTNGPILMAISAASTMAVFLSTASAFLTNTDALHAVEWVKIAGEGGSMIHAGITNAIVPSTTELFSEWSSTTCSSVGLAVDPCVSCAESGNLTTILMLGASAISLVALMFDWQRATGPDRSQGCQQRSALASSLAASASAAAAVHFSWACASNFSSESVTAGTGFQLLLAASFARSLLCMAHVRHSSNDQVAPAFPSYLPVTNKFAGNGSTMAGNQQMRAAPLYAHHVQHKATKGHTKNRPKKSRKSDRERTPPSYNTNPGNYEGAPPEFVVKAQASQ